ncbi:MAG TPA: DUF4012 domain-containing protein [Microthrixaceae bacterium]|nr:DUF4012 domain-containing protein [Microthrixaceae bacterium]
MSSDDTPTVDTPADRRWWRRRWWRRRWWLPALGVVVVWAVAAAVVAVDARRHADRGIEAFDEVAPVASGSLSRLLDSLGNPRPENLDRPVPDLLHDAADEFAMARDSLRSIVFSPLLAVPVMGRQLRSARSLATVAAQLGDASADAYDQLRRLMDEASNTPEARLAAGREAESVLRDVQSRIEDVDLGPSEALVGGLARAHRRLEHEQSRVADTLDLALDAVTGLNSFLTGPTRYLLLASNNAEMRAGSGMWLQIGVLTVAEGRFEVNDLQATRDLTLPAPGTQLDPDVEANWGPLEPDQEWRNINVTPRFDESARMATDMWSTIQPPVDGAISIDIAGITALLEVTGPVDVEGRTISADDAVDYLLLEQYREFPDQVEAREDRIEQAARSVLTAFNERSWSPNELLGSLDRAGRARHIMLWSTEEIEQRGWEAVGAAGLVGDDDMLLAVLSLGGNKLDQFLDLVATTSVEPAAEGTKMRVTIDVVNNTPDEPLPRYVQGSYPGLGLPPGAYLGIVQLTIPGSAARMAITGGTPAVQGNDGLSKVLGTEVRVDRGATARVEFEFVLPDGTEEVELLASARLPPTTWHHAGDTWRDRQPRDVPLS